MSGCNSLLAWPVSVVYCSSSIMAIPKAKKKRRIAVIMSRYVRNTCTGLHHSNGLDCLCPDNHGMSNKVSKIKPPCF